MFNLTRIFDDWPYLGRILSIIIGFGIAIMCRPGCRGADCFQYRGPNVKEINGAVYQYGAKCVEFDAKAIECPKNGVIEATGQISE